MVLGAKAWVRKRVEAHPNEPVLERAIELFRSRKLWLTDADVLDAVLERISIHLTDDGSLTSTGRWLLSRIDQDADGVFAAASRLESTSDLYGILAGHRSDLFETFVSKLVLKEDHEKSRIPA